MWEFPSHKKQKGFFFCAALLLILLFSAFPGPFRSFGEEGPFGKEEGPVRIVATIYPVYDWILQILGDNPGGCEVTLLFDKGVDPHSYQPTVPDILKISESDLFVYVGGESDKWVEDALSEAVNPALRKMKLLDLLGDHLREEEIVEGMQEGRPGVFSGEEEEEEEEFDEHVWLSLSNAVICCEQIEEELAELDPSNAPVYERNLQNYVKELRDLDDSYRESVSKAAKDTLVFGDRFPFLYLLKDYGISYYAAFAGCSAETEASFKTIVFLIDKLDSLSLSCVMTMENPDLRIPRTIIRNSDDPTRKILTLDSMQSSTSGDYLSVMKQNLEILKEALN